MANNFIAYLACLIGLCADTNTALGSGDSANKSNTEANVVLDTSEAVEYNYQLDGIKASIPKPCRQVTEYFIGFDNPIRDASQIYQESTCNSFAKSPYAYGIAQITPKTGKSWAKGFCSHLGPYKKYDNHWQLSCFKIAMDKTQSYVDRKYPLYDYCTNRAINEQIYNGGYWVVKEIDKAGSFIKARQICGKVKLANGKKRAGWACKENYGYPVYITKRQLNFKKLGGKQCYIN